MPINKNELDALTSGAIDQVVNLENIVWSLMVKLLLSAHEDASRDDADEWQRDMLSKAGDMLDKANHSLNSPFRGIKDKELQQLYSLATSKTTELGLWLEKAGATSSKNSNRNSIHKLLKARQEQTGDYIDLARLNMTKNSYNQYRQIVSDSALAVRNGQPFDKALSDSMLKWSDYGIPALVDKAGKHWSPDVYMRMMLNNEYSNAVSDAELERIKQSSSLVKVSWHAGSRPTHVGFQGNVYSLTGDTVEYPNFYLATDYGSITGLCGLNCHHYFMAYVPGYGEYQPEMSTEENNHLYELNQEQRRIERTIRKYKRKAEIASSFGDDVGLSRYNDLVRRHQGIMRDFISHNELLTRQRERESIRGYDELEKIKYLSNVQAMSKKFTDLQNELGSDNLPRTIDEYRKLLYNDGKEFNFLIKELREQKKWTNASFSSERNYNAHYKKHSAEFDGITKQQYLQSARKILAETVSDNILGYQLENGRRVRYDKQHNIFAVGTANGRISTFFKPTEGEAYYYANKRKDIG